MQVSDFDYELPEELIAQRPLSRRDLSRMMTVDRKSGQVRHSLFKHIKDFFRPGDVLVINETRVLPARMWGTRGQSRIEFLFLGPIGDGLWEVLCRPARRVRQGDAIVFTPRLQGEVVEVRPEGRRVLSFPDSDVRAELHKDGYAPLPPYIKRSPEHQEKRAEDLERYQTVFARREGSIAAPTAGLHFTPKLLDGIRENGVLPAPICLEVGLATFQPVRVDRVEDHMMLEETYSIPKESAELINAARREGRPVWAVGTTSVRCLESAASEGLVRPGPGSTRLFIHPGYQFQVVDRLLTNFHLPRSTLLMLTAALGGVDLIMQAYREAVREKYRFYSYGDCMLIL
jgi:S-adenosylmethionine:tRNA ribosyltransferase-isomerase